MRRAASLVEILIAIFIMGIGLLAILALFPVGVMKMDQSIADGKAVNLARNAEAIIKAHALDKEPSDAMFINPDRTFGGVGPFPQDADPNGPSYPVYIDPVGQLSAAGGVDQNWIAGNAGVVVRAGCSLVVAPRPAEKAIRWFSSSDELHFNPDDGRPKQVVSGGANRSAVIERDRKWTFAFMVQRPRTADPEVTNVAIVVYRNRPLTFAGGQRLGETAYNATFDVVPGTDRTTGTVRLNHGKQLPPNVRAGSWILNASSWVDKGYRRTLAKFHQVMRVTSESASTVIEVAGDGFPEFHGTSAPRAAGSYVGLVFVMEHVAQVFTKRPGL